MATTFAAGITLVIGDDYKSANSRQLEIEFLAVSGMTAGTATSRLNLVGGSGPLRSLGVTVTGTTADVGGGNWKAVFELDDTTLASLKAGSYDYSVACVQSSNTVTVAYNTENKGQILVIDRRIP